MATPEKKQSSIASFFSPVNRSIPLAISKDSTEDKEVDETKKPCMGSIDQNIIHEKESTKSKKRKNILKDESTSNLLITSDTKVIGATSEDKNEQVSSIESIKTTQENILITTDGQNDDTLVSMENIAEDSLQQSKFETPQLRKRARKSKKEDPRIIIIDDDDSMGNSESNTTSPKVSNKNQSGDDEYSSQTDVRIVRPKRKSKTPEKAMIVPELPKVKLNPIQVQKLTLYRQKLSDIEELFTDLVNGKNQDSIMQEVHGTYLDIGLNLSQEEIDHCRDSYNNSIKSTSTENWIMPMTIKSYIARRMQGRMDCISKLAGSILSQLIAWHGSDVDFINTAVLEIEMKSIAERVSYGVKPKNAHMFQDSSIRALWMWEVGSLETHFDENSCRIIKRMRKQRRRTGQIVKTLDKILLMIEEGVVDESKLSVEESKVGKFFSVVEQEVQRAVKKNEQEKQRASERDLKHQQQLEKEEAKRLEQETKKKEKEEVIAQKRKMEQIAQEKVDMELKKRRETWGNFLKKSDTKSNEVKNIEKASKLARAMEKIDEEIRTGGNHTRSLTFTTRSKSPSVGAWSNQRKRHPTLGVKKLLQFHENFRPAYWGTFSKKSRQIKRGRRPLAFISSLDYSAESDLEWEEDEIGESLSDKDSDEDQGEDEDRLDYGDQWLAYEDEVDYMDDIPGEELDSEQKSSKKKVAEHHHRPSKLIKLIPRILGPILNADMETEDLCSFQVEILFPPNFQSPLLKMKSTPVQELHDVEKNESQVESKNLTTWLKPKSK